MQPRRHKANLAFVHLPINNILYILLTFSTGALVIFVFISTSSIGQEWTKISIVRRTTKYWWGTVTKTSRLNAARRQTDANGSNSVC
jgi:hypothetical protein